MDSDRRRRLLNSRILPVIVLEDAGRASALGQALVAGGLATAEVALRTPAALESIRVMAQEASLFVGAGTVISRAAVAQLAAIESGTAA